MFLHLHAATTESSNRENFIPINMTDGKEKQMKNLYPRISLGFTDDSGSSVTTKIPFFISFSYLPIPRVQSIKEETSLTKYWDLIET